jgi:hypothetical protein
MVSSTQQSYCAAHGTDFHFQRALCDAALIYDKAARVPLWSGAAG